MDENVMCDGQGTLAEVNEETGGPVAQVRLDLFLDLTCTGCVPRPVNPMSFLGALSGWHSLNPTPVILCRNCLMQSRVRLKKRRAVPSTRFAFARTSSICLV